MKLRLPLCVHFPRARDKDKPFYLNLNIYRNAHFRVLNNAKILYKEQVYGAVLESGLRPNTFKLTPPLRMVYTLFAATKRDVDVANVLSVVDKFTSDALVELGFIEDDNYRIIREVVYRFGMIDRDRPRVELEIDEYQGEKDTELQRRLDFADQAE
jgi:Holliday junction resolvase RusA-like endonuclease